MKLIFRGWRREVVQHHHSVLPVTCESGSYSQGETDDPITWHSALSAFGKVNELALTGSFLIELEFEQAELRNWLREFVRAKPEAAIKLLATMQGEAILALAKKTEERVSQNNSLQDAPDES